MEITYSVLKVDGVEGQSENPLSRELEQAYMKMTDVSVTDLSKQGEANWMNAKSEYTKVADKIESQISNSLTDQLASAQNANEQFRIFGRFKK